MKIAVFGAGAIGSYVGGLLHAAGLEVTLIGRGAHLRAMQKDGLRLVMEEEERVLHPPCTDDASEVGAADIVLVTLKAHSISGACEAIGTLLGPKTAVLTAINGMPWWYFYRLEGPWRDQRLASVDPDGRQWDLIGPERALGCAVYPTGEITEPGRVKVVRHSTLNRLPLGEPDGVRSERVVGLSKALIAAGFKAPVIGDIRTEIWVKLWGNLAFNPIGALTCATLGESARDPGTRALARNMMLEAEAIARCLGVTMPISIDQRIKGAESVGAHKTSMLQDLERGRPMEIEPLIGAVIELGRMVGVATPFIDAVYALICQRAKEAGCSPAPAG